MRLESLGLKQMSADQTTPKAATLDELRQAIDRIDDTLLDLIVERASIVEGIGAAKKAAGDAPGIFLRPGREMAILRRLLARHSGPFPKAVVVRLWRELFASLVALQGPLAVAVYMPARGAGFLEIARDQYGSYTPMTASQTTPPVVRAVSEGDATVGILPLPQPDDPQPWWASLVSDSPSTPRIVAKLPTAGPGHGRGDGAEALAIARLQPEPTGDDRSFVVVETPSSLSRAGLRGFLESAGLVVVDITDGYDIGGEARLHLIEVEGYLLADDPRLKQLGETQQVSRTTVIGGYAKPFTAEELGV